MLKNFITLVVLSLAVIYGTPHIHPLITALVSAHDWISQLLLDVFTGGTVGNIIRQFIALLALPIIIALIPALIFWIARKRFFPYFFHTLWVLWLIQTTALVLRYKVPGV